MMSSITMNEFMSLKDVTVLDVREPEEYVMGHIPNSTHIPLMMLEHKLNSLDKNDVYYVVCHSGSRSHYACMIMANQGYKVINILGGMSAYKGALSYEMR